MVTTVEELTPIRRGNSRFEYRAGDLHLVVDQIHAHSSRTIDAWVTLRWLSNIDGQYLHGARHDITGSTFAQRLGRICADRMPKAKVDWVGIIEAARFDVVSAIFDGHPPVRLTDVTTTAEEGKPRWLIRPLVGATGTTSLVAPGGSTKSFFALAAAVMVATGRSKPLQLRVYDQGPVLYLDWEADAETHKERMKAICRPHGIDPPTNLWYRAETQPLWRSINSLERIVEDEGVKMVVIDSVMLARSGDAFGPEDTTRMYQALRRLGVPALLIDHKSREALRKGWKGAYGSVVNDNTSRLMWEVWPIVEMGPEKLRMKFEITKRNNVAKMDPLGFEVTFANGEDELLAVDIRQVAPSTVVPFAEPDSVADLILMVLRFAGADGMMAKDIAAEVEKSDNQVRARLGDLLRDGRATKIETPHGNRWFATDFEERRKLPPTGTDDLPDNII